MRGRGGNLSSGCEARTHSAAATMAEQVSQWLQLAKGTFLSEDAME